MLFGALVLIGLAYLNSLATSEPSERSNELYNKRSSLLGACQQNAETLHSMGMTLNMSALWSRTNGNLVDEGVRLSDRGNFFDRSPRSSA